MIGLFRPTSSLSGGLLWKNPWRISQMRKTRHRARLRRIDKIISIVSNALAIRGTGLKAIDQWKANMPTEAEMRPKDKYTFFDRKEKGYRKGVHELPKWTRVSQRINPPGF